MFLRHVRAEKTQKSACAHAQADLSLPFSPGHSGNPNAEGRSEEAQGDWVSEILIRVPVP